MAVNKDGLDTDKPVDFETLQTMIRQHREGKKDASTDTAATRPVKTGRPRKQKTMDDQTASESA